MYAAVSFISIILWQLMFLTYHNKLLIGIFKEFTFISVSFYKLDQFVFLF